MALSWWEEAEERKADDWRSRRTRLRRDQNLLCREPQVAVGAVAVFAEAEAAGADAGGIAAELLGRAEMEGPHRSGQRDVAVVDEQRLRGLVANEDVEGVSELA